MSSKTKPDTINLTSIIGKGYATFWHSKARYRVVKGSRASKKSKTAALWLIFNIMRPSYKQANAVVFRKTYRTIKDSCFSDLRWAIHRLGADALWTATQSPLELTYNKTGQKILFRGLDDPLKVTSLSVPNGVLCWAWLEEAYELSNEADFNMIDESIRGIVQKPLFKGWIITLNPWNEHHWIKARFFDKPRANTLAMTTNYLCNEWLDKEDEALFDAMKETNPRRYQVAGLGNWGIVEGLIYENWTDQAFSVSDVLARYPDAQTVFGLDFGYTNDPAALFCGVISKTARRVWVFDEIYRKGMSNRALYEEIQRRGYAKERIIADGAEPKSVDELRSLGLKGIKASKKGADSIMNGVQFIQDYKIIVHPACVNFLTEVSNYTWAKDKFGRTLNRPEDDFNHLMDAMRYALERSRPIHYHEVKGGF